MPTTADTGTCGDGFFEPVFFFARQSDILLGVPHVCGKRLEILRSQQNTIHAI